MYYEHEELEYDTWIVRLASNVNSHKSPLIGTSSLSTLLSFFHSLTILLYEEKSAIIDTGKFNDISRVVIIYSIMVDLRIIYTLWRYKHSITFLDFENNEYEESKMVNFGWLKVQIAHGEKFDLIWIAKNLNDTDYVR